MKCIKILLPALIKTDEQKEMTERCKKSIISIKHCLELTEDNNYYHNRIAGVWNNFLDTWDGKDYDYLMITANDTILDPSAIDFAIETLEEHPEAGVCTLHVTRDLELFQKGFGQKTRSGDLTIGYHNMDPANFVIRKGIIEVIGRMDPEFPLEFVERDYWRRCNLAGFIWIEPKEILNYHPATAGTIGNDNNRLNKYLRKYIRKWGGDAGSEKFLFPYNDTRLDLTFIGNYQ